MPRGYRKQYDWLASLANRQRGNEAAKSVMVTYALDADLDQIDANNSVERLTITPALGTTIPRRRQ